MFESSTKYGVPPTVSSLFVFSSVSDKVITSKGFCAADRDRIVLNISLWSSEKKSDSTTNSATVSKELLLSIKPPITACSASTECGN